LKVTGFIGSSRKNGITAKVVNNLVQTLAHDGSSNVYYLSEKNINYCTGCEFCRKNDSCSQMDDMTFLLEEMYQSDVIVIGTPVFFGEMSSLTKTFTDRLYPAYRGKGISRLRGKKLYLVYSQHSSPEVYYDVRACEASYLFKFLGFDIVKVFVNGTEVSHT
jgi:multimeric flavodoxin WrbA